MRGKVFALTLALALLLCPLRVLADENMEELNLEEELPAAVQVIAIDQSSIPAKSAVLMEQESGRVLYEHNPDEQLPPASVTKVMTLLLVMEALDSGKITLEDQVTTSEHAASMGGSQIWLKVGEQMSVNDLLKAVAVSSANDASVALGEHLAGSHEAFVDQMNRRALELGMVNTTFKNCTGLDEEGHLTTARDIAIMSRELMKHERITEYSTIWMDSLRGGETELVNTNRMVRFYEGATGLKTGTTNGAGSCLSATAKRSDLSLVAVVMGCPTSDERFASARGLLDYGFANYMSVTPPAVDDQLFPVKVLRGTENYVMPVYDAPGALIVDKMSEDAIQQQVTLVEDVQAPVHAGQVLGQVEILVDGQVVGSYPLKAGSSVEKMDFGNAFGVLVRAMLTMNSRQAAAQRDPAPAPLETVAEEQAEQPPADAQSGSETASAMLMEDALQAEAMADTAEDAVETVAWAENMDGGADQEDDEETVETVAWAENMDEEEDEY